ncbi:MAG: histidinol phosphate phosphatase [Candidatus Eisenbacteria bacterium]|uniref:Histidinol phosphate phosphatase n=1 Tax=Eiseniibacteriota bacterium TaxID=2212470 RepID=A0A538SLH8_UNCEI|nr:MAG: histidinol phosphate phosphatase [Candidatus Eisenbacteria bacterium]
MSEAPHTWLQAVAEVAKLAGDAALRHYPSPPAVELKSDGSPVTVADRDAEGKARAFIEEFFPGDGILGEEFGVSRPDAPRRWLIDPIDGTASFIRGVPLWGSLVAVVEGERVVAGAAYFPVIGDILTASPGHGCFRNGYACSASSISDLARATAVTTDERFARHPERRAGWARLAGRVQVARTWGDCFGYLMVATGRAEVMVDPVLSPWDAAAVMPIVEEAGGVFTDWSGRRTAFGGSAIATNAGVAKEARLLLAEPAGAPEKGSEHA